MPEPESISENAITPEAAGLPYEPPVEMTAPVAEEQLRQYCLFRAGRERYCLSVLDVEEVLDWPSLTPVPLGPAFLMGIFNLRGAIVPVIDIAFTEGRRADLPPRHVVVAALQLPDEEILRLGIAADEVIGTCATAEPLLVQEAPRDVPHCCGMLHHEEKLALALNLERVLEAFPVGVI